MDNTNFTEETKKVLKAFQDERVEFLIIGAHALGAHGVRRTTSDVDIWISIEPQNLGCIRQALLVLGSTQQVVDEVINYLLENKFTRVSFLGEDYHLDLLATVKGLEWTSAVAEAVTAEIDGVFVKVISLDHLIAAKRASRRFKDVMDMHNLLAIKKTTA